MRESGNEIRSPFHAVTDLIYCPEPQAALGPTPAGHGLPGVLGSKSSQLLHGRDFLIFFLPLFITKQRVFVTIFFSFCIST